MREKSSLRPMVHVIRNIPTQSNLTEEEATCEPGERRFRLVPQLSPCDAPTIPPYCKLVSCLRTLHRLCQKRFQNQRLRRCRQRTLLRRSTLCERGAMCSRVAGRSASPPLPRSRASSPPSLTGRRSRARGSGAHVSRLSVRAGQRAAREPIVEAEGEATKDVPSCGRQTKATR